jgi:putative DNA primase/helicase
MPDELRKIHPADLAGDVARALGGAKRVGNGWRARCPVHDGSDPNLSLSNGDAGPLLVKCWSHGCNPKDILLELRRRGLLDDERRERRRPEGQRDWKPPREVEPKPEPDQNMLRWLLKRLQPIEGTVVATYLANVRGVDLPPEGHHLRYLPANPPKYEWPCMVGIVTDFTNADRVIDMHFTRLALDGSGKAPIEAPKGTLKGYSPSGGVVRLCDDADVTVRLGVAEGIEKALSIMTSYRRDLDRDEIVWSAISAGNMRKLPVVSGIETLAIYGDKNDVGRTAAAGLKRRWLDAGRETETHFPPGADWDEAP